MSERIVDGIRLVEWHPGTFICASCGVFGWGWPPLGPGGWSLGEVEDECLCASCVEAGQSPRYQRTQRLAEGRANFGRTAT